MKDTSKNSASLHGLKLGDTGKNGVKLGDTGRNGVKPINVMGNGAKSVNMERDNTKLDGTERNRKKLENNGVKGTGRIDAKIKKFQKENIQNKSTKKKDIWNKRKR